MGIKYQDEILALIARDLAGLAGPDETAQLNEWIWSLPENRRYYEQVRNIWDASDKKTDNNSIKTSEALVKVLGRIPAVSERRSFWFYWQRIAAVILIPLVLGTLLLLYFNSPETISSNELVYNEVYAAYGTRSSLLMADSTVVWLNSGSRLKYPNKFSTNNRHVFLNGEAYFEVKSNVSRPFIVQTSTLQVKATGTKFNVQEYESNPGTEVTLVSGKVSVCEMNNNNQLISDLDPDQHLVYNRQTGEKKISTGNTYPYISWKDGKLIFRNEPLDKVMNRISILFNVEIEIQGEELNEYRYRATFQDESLEEILALLKLSAPVNFREVKRKPLPDGSFPAKKVIIFPVKHKIHN